MQNILLKVLIVLRANWPWPSRSILASFQNRVYLHRFCVIEIFMRLAKTEFVELFNIPNGSAHVLIPKFWPTVSHHGPWSSLDVYLVIRSLASTSCQLSLLKGYRGVFHTTVMHYHIQPDAQRAYCRKSSLHMTIWQDRPLLAQMFYH